MTFETLMHIYSLLKDEERRTSEAYNEASARHSDLIYEDAAKDQIRAAEDRTRQLSAQHSKALGALLEFERKEWR